ncbi:hypothetical protein PoB_000011200 [Plakobranchus ocellatus]|uniref:Band 7 domain-containing protein n=1 Tax=Plakobranchus ocellatus TaxID=259542 RepID=A0AAV3XS25_9GAST|nr:hypothetical protein PoB_000011200 [Plakobranchus ocellatus]
MAGENGNQCILYLVAGVVGIGILLTVILVPMSFSGLDYYEYGFKRQKSTGTVKTDKVYTGGKYMIGPDYGFKTFQASAHFTDFTPLEVYTWNKLEIEIDVTFQYFLRKDDLPYLHKTYDVNYDTTIRTSAISAIKLETVKWKTDQFITHRKDIEASLFMAVRNKLGGKCCRKDCDSWRYACPKGCTNLTLCNNEKDKGLWVDVKYFQLGAIRIPADVEERRLTRLVTQEEVDGGKYKQDASVVRKNTEAIVRDIKNQAAELREKARAESQQINTIARANYTAVVEKARSQGLKELYDSLGIKDQKTKSSFDYLRTLRGLNHVHLTVDFQQRIVGGFGGSG